MLVVAGKEVSNYNKTSRRVMRCVITSITLTLQQVFPLHYLTGHPLQGKMGERLQTSRLLLFLVPVLGCLHFASSTSATVSRTLSPGPLRSNSNTRVSCMSLIISMLLFVHALQHLHGSGARAYVTLINVNGCNGTVASVHVCGKIGCVLIPIHNDAYVRSCMRAIAILPSIPVDIRSLPNGRLMWRWVRRRC